VTAPIASKIPPGSSDVGEIGIDHQADLRGVESAFANSAVTKAALPNWPLCGSLWQGVHAVDCPKKDLAARSRC
jgi:hypothetical protein